MPHESDTEMGDETGVGGTVGIGVGVTDHRRISVASTRSAADSMASHRHHLAREFTDVLAPPASVGTGSAATSRRSSLANLVNDLDVVDGDEDEDDDDEDDEGDIEDPRHNHPRSSISISNLTEQVQIGSNTTSTAHKAFSIPVLVHPTPSEGYSHSVPVNQPPPPPPPTSTAKPASKPRSKSSKNPPNSHAGRSPSPSPPPAPPPPPMQTIRLNIKLGGPSNYEVDIAKQAKETGQRTATPPLGGEGAAEKGADSESESEREKEKEKEGSKPEDAAAAEEEGGKPKSRKRKKKNAASEYYDTSDPFIDDSELAVDQRTYFAQTKQQGFYVSSGEVALLKDKSPKKPKSKKPTVGSALHPSSSHNTLLPQPVASTSGPPPSNLVGTSLPKKEPAGVGTRDSPIALIDGDDDGEGDDKKSTGVETGLANGKGKGKGKGDADDGGEDGVDGDEKVGQKRKRYITVVEGGKKRKVVNINSFHPDLQVAIEGLKQSIAKESWEHKGKFPPSLKPQLAQLALLAVKLDEYDDHFFNLMPVLFPYNKFTMTKLIKRTVYPDHLALLTERQETLLKELEELARVGFPKAQEEWEKSVIAWDKRQERMRLEAANPDGGTAGSTGTGSAGPTRHPTEEKDTLGMDVDGGAGEDGAGKDKDGGKDGKDGAHGQHPPGKKFRLTEQMKAILWDLVLLSNECCRLENEKNSYEGSVIQVSDQGLRKVLYQKIVAAFPEGWMSSGQISRDVSAMKKKFEKEALENEG